jgi:hypothetical protein
MHILSLVLGIFGVILIFVPLVNFIFAPMLSAAALITGAIARTLVRYKGNEDDRKIASAGLILGGAGLVLSFMLYGSCAWLVDKWYEPGERPFFSDEKKDKLDERMDKMEEKLHQDLERLSDTVEERMAEMEERLPPGPPPEIDQGDELRDTIEQFLEKKDAVKQDLEKWEEWLKQMPALKDRKGDDVTTRTQPAPGAAKEKVEEDLETPEIFKKVPEKAESKKTAGGSKEKKPKAPLKEVKKFEIKEIEPTVKDAKDYELLSPYEYF